MLLIIQSIIVYGLMIWVMTYSGKIAYKSQYPKGFGNVNLLANNEVSFVSIFTKSYFIVPIFVFCFFAAVRYRVGVDCESYKQIFYEIGWFGSSAMAEDIEIGFATLAKFVYNFTGTHYLLLFILAFLQIVFYYCALRNNRYAFVFLGLAIILSGHYWSLMNGMRQNIVACAFVAMLPLILEKKWVYYILAVFVASLMHRSAFVLLPLGIVVYFSSKKILPIKIQLIILAISFVLMGKIDGIFSSELMGIVNSTGYSEEKITAYTELENTTKNFGLQMIIFYIVYVLIIIFSSRMNKLFDSKIYTTMYNLFFLGICLSLIFYNNFTIHRLLYYLSCFVPIILSCFLFYLWKYKLQNYMICVIALLLLRLVWAMYSNVSENGQFESMLYKFDF